MKSLLHAGEDSVYSFYLPINGQVRVAFHQRDCPPLHHERSPSFYSRDLFAFWYFRERIMFNHEVEAVIEPTPVHVKNAIADWKRRQGQSSDVR